MALGMCVFQVVKFGGKRENLIAVQVEQKLSSGHSCEFRFTPFPPLILLVSTSIFIATFFLA
jgi:hypothetical protein